MSSIKSFEMYSDKKKIKQVSKNYVPPDTFQEEDITDKMNEEFVLTPKETSIDDSANNYSTNPSKKTQRGIPNSTGNIPKQLGQSIFKQKIYSFAEKTAKKFLPSNMSSQARQVTGIIATYGIAHLLDKYFNKK